MVGHWLRLLGTAAVFLASLATTSMAAPPIHRASAADVEAALLQPHSDETGSSQRYRFRTWLREKFVTEADLARYGLRLEDGWEDAAADKPVVILLHGFNSCPVSSESVMAPIREAGYPCGSFAYPNDHLLQASAQLLASELRRFAEFHPDRRLVLVCHSMGGLVARACLENSLYDPGNVDRLIMIAPPTHGSMIAHFAVGTDLWEHWIARRRGSPWARFRDSVIDGLGEAAGDLVPGSPFLDELNARPRNRSVRYSIILGSAALVNESQMVWIRESVCDRLAQVPGANGSAERLEAILADIDELVDGRGDGVVAVKRGRLDGVSDTIILPFGHLAVTGKAGTEPVREVHQAVLTRIESQRTASIRMLSDAGP